MHSKYSKFKEKFLFHLKQYLFYNSNFRDFNPSTCSKQGDTTFQNLKQDSKDNHAFCFQQTIIRKLYFMDIRCLWKPHNLNFIKINLIYIYFGVNKSNSHVLFQRFFQSTCAVFLRKHAIFIVLMYHVNLFCL